MATAVNDLAIQQQLSEMSDASLRPIYDWLSAKFGQGENTTPSDMSVEQLFVWDTVKRACVQHGVRRVPPVYAFIKHYGKARFIRAVDLMQEYIDRGCSVTLQRNERAAITSIIVECLVDWLEDRGRMVTPQTVLDGMSAMPAAVEAAYPGYYRSRMLHQLVQLYRTAV
jgi:hypothetical protein